MGFLTLNQALNMNKAVISLWFRVPTAAATAVGNATSYFGWPVLNGVVPLITFGAQLSGTTYDFGSVVIYNEGIYADDPVLGDVIAGSHSVPQSPSCIGLGLKADGSPYLFFHLQTANQVTATNTRILVTGASSGAEGIHFEFTDASYTTAAEYQFFGNALEGTGPPAALNRWHHVLLSWDLGTGNAVHGVQGGSPYASSVDRYSLLYCAVDDVNKNGADLPANWAFADGSGGSLNAMLCNACMNWNGSTGSEHQLDSGHLGAPHYFGDPSVAVDFSQIPSNPITIPGPVTLQRASNGSGGSESFEARPGAVDLAELQIFTGVTLDTSNVTNRRAFIGADRRPVESAVAQALLGKAPEVLFHDSANWAAGTNTGSGGAFTPTGTINPFAAPGL